MKLFIDCEFNSYLGDLISLALVPEDNKSDCFYEVLPCANPHPWVAEHVMPITGKSEIVLNEFQFKLQQYVMQFDSIHVVADWPEDISYLCKALIVGPGARLDTPPMTFEVLRIDTVSPIPHNALADAMALRAALLNSAQFAG